MSRVLDVDGDGHADLVVVNGENGVTSELDSYVYWGGPGGLGGERAVLPTAGAYDVAATDITGNGLVDLIFPSAWVDHHNGGAPRLLRVYEQRARRAFTDASEQHGLIGVAATAAACGDLSGDGCPDLVVANYRDRFAYDTDSFLYRGNGHGFDADRPLRLPTHYAMQVLLADLDQDGFKEIIFAGGDRVDIYWNERGAFSPARRTTLAARGQSTMFCVGAIRVAVADLDGDGRNELLVCTEAGVEIRDPDDPGRVRQLLPLPWCTWVEAVDLDGDGRPDIIASRYQDGRRYETGSALFWNGPQGHAADRVTLLPTAGAMGCTAGDLDGDGRPEIVFNNTMGGPSQFDPDFPMFVYLGSREHRYTPERRLELPTGGSTNTYALADFDLDGHADLAITSSEGLRLFHGGPDGLRPDRYQVLPHRGAVFNYVLAADLNRDGWLDLVAVAYTYDDRPETLANSSMIFYGSPDGFAPERSQVVPTYCRGNARLADVNGDGWLDLIYADLRGDLVIYLGGPDGYGPDRAWHVPLGERGLGAVTAINCADLDGNGWPDLIMSVMGHYERRESGFLIIPGGPDGFDADRIRFHRTPASPILVSVADVNRDGYLDLLVPAYSTQFTRVLPAHIYWGGAQGFDFEHPFVIPCEACCAFVAIDITGNGFLDVLAICHRNDLGHQVDSLLFWNGPEGLSVDRVTRLPGLGPHLSSPRDFGNALTREPQESYLSPPHEMGTDVPTRLSWEADVPGDAAVRFQLRWSPTCAGLDRAPWRGPSAQAPWFEAPGQTIQDVDPAARWLQYKASLVSPNGCHQPSLQEVRVTFGSA